MNETRERVVYVPGTMTVLEARPLVLLLTYHETPGLFFVHTNDRGLLTSCDLQCLLFHARVKLRS